MEECALACNCPSILSRNNDSDVLMMEGQKINALVVDDEPPARRKLENWLHQEDDIARVSSCPNAFEAIEELKRHPYDVLFLDIQMPQMNGFDMLHHVPIDARPLVVFVTSFDQYAIDAFNYHAVDYLLKPYDHSRFINTLDRVRERIAMKSSSAIQSQLTHLLESMGSASSYLSHFTIKEPDSVRLVKVESVHWISAEGNYVMLHMGEKKHLVRDNIGRLATRLDPKQFPRIHRSTIVQLDFVDAFFPASHGDYTVVMKDGTQLFMSRTYKNQVRDVLQVGL